MSSKSQCIRSDRCELYDLIPKQCLLSGCVACVVGALSIAMFGCVSGVMVHGIVLKVARRHTGMVATELLVWDEGPEGGVTW